MKRLCFVIIFVSIFSCFCAEEKTDFGETYIGNPDNFAKIVRPCPVYDLNCIRKFLASHSQCKITNGPLPAAFVIDQYDLLLEDFNVTVNINNKPFTGLRNARIEEFYVNYATNQVVFAIEIRNQVDFVPSLYFKFHRRGREPIVVHSNANIRFELTTYTAVIPNIKNLQFDQMEATAYLSDTVIVPPFTLGPELLTHTDPLVQQTLAEIATNAADTVQAVLLYDSPFLPAAYIKYNLCDFGYDKIKRL